MRSPGKKFRLALPFIGALAVLATLTGCDFGSTSGSATVRVLLTDAPFPFEMVDSANVTIERVELVGDASGVIDVTADWDEPRAFNLLDLRDSVTVLLGEVVVPEGKYGQIRLIVQEEAAVVMSEESGGEVYNLKVPSGTQTGIKIPLQGLEIEGDSYITLTLDFDVNESFVVLGGTSSPAEVEGFIFKPVVKLLDVETSPSDEPPADE